MNLAVSRSEGAAEGGCGGNSAAPERWKPRHLLEYLRAETRRKTLFSLEEKEIRRAQNEKSKEYFPAGHASEASGGGAVQFCFRSKKVRAKCKISPHTNTATPKGGCIIAKHQKKSYSILKALEARRLASFYFSSYALLRFYSPTLISLH